MKDSTFPGHPVVVASKETNNAAWAILEPRGELMTRALTVGFAILALQSCSSGPTLPQKPQLKLDRSSIGFGQEFGSGTFVGTEPTQSLQITNGGQDTLNITSVTLGGADMAAFTQMGPSSMTLKSGDQTFVQLIFKPEMAKLYDAELDIASNADPAVTMTNCGPTCKVAVSGKGIDIVSIEITPANASLQAGSSMQLNAEATFSDSLDGGTGTVSSVNSIATWSSSDTGVATVDMMGKLSGVAAASDGGAATAEISATAHGITGHLTVTVHN
jgi:hypothetical protein